MEREEAGGVGWRCGGGGGSKRLLQEEKTGVVMREGERWQGGGGKERLICMLLTVSCLFDLEGVLSAGWWDAAE